MINLLDHDRAGLERFFAERGEKPYRARQVFRRLHQANATTTDDYLADLPKSLRQALAAEVCADEPPLATVLPAADGVDKLLFGVGGEQIEAVIIPETRRTTLCVSSQVGCALACRFCLTGKQGFSRNLSTAHILSQVRTANRVLAQRGAPPVTNVVFMGMGEPLLNLDAVLPALRTLTDDLGYALSPRRVTVSTAGVVPAMQRLRDGARAALAVSLHAPTDSLRNDIMPINRKYPLAALMDACRRHIADQPRAFVTFEYVMLDGINDSDTCARDLTRLLHGTRCKVNLIPFNTFAGAPYRVSPMPRILAFQAKLKQSGVITTVRKTRGDDILAACGQLAGEVRARTRGLARTEAPLVRT